jgi:hypothetical protein
MELIYINDYEINPKFNINLYIEKEITNSLNIQVTAVIHTPIYDQMYGTLYSELISVLWN